MKMKMKELKLCNLKLVIKILIKKRRINKKMRLINNKAKNYKI